MKIKELNSPLGKIILIANGGELVYCNWKHEDCKLKQMAVEKSLDDVCSDDEDNEILIKAASQLIEYFNGDLYSFNIPIRFSGTEFQNKIWREIIKIEAGKTATYKELAKKSGYPKGYRAVANACGRNPLAIIIPCHRVVASNGELGGYTGGTDKKIWLLHHESQKIFG